MVIPTLQVHTGTLVPDSEAAEELGRRGDTTGRFTKGTLDLTAVQGIGAFLHPPRGLVRAIRLRKAHRGDELMSRDAASRQRMWFMAGKIF